MDNPSGSQANKRVFLSNPLQSDLRLSGTARADLAAALGGPASNLSVMLVDYGPGTQMSKSSDGVTLDTTASCWGAGTDSDPCAGRPSATPARSRTDVKIEDACYLDPVKPMVDVTQWRVTRGVLDSRNRNSLWYADATDVVPGEFNRFGFPTQPTEHIFKAGHQIGIIVAGTNTSEALVAPAARTTWRSRSTPRRARSRCRSSAATARWTRPARSPTRPAPSAAPCRRRSR